MSRLQDIDTKHPMTVSAYKRNNANPLRSMEFIPGTEISLDRFEVEKLIEWIAGKDVWRRKFEQDLQCTFEDLEGNLLLETWMTIDEILQMLDEGKDLPVMQRLQAESQDWKAKGSVEVSFGACKLSSIKCPVDDECAGQVKREVISKLIRHLTHTEMSFVLPVVTAGLKDLMKLDCTISFPKEVQAGSRLFFSVTSESDKKRVDAVLSKMAEEIHACAYGCTSLVEARAMFGLDPLRFLDRQRFFVISHGDPLSEMPSSVKGLFLISLLIGLALIWMAH